MTLQPDRVLILAPNARDAQLTKQTLERRGLACDICPDLQNFLHAIEENAGVGILAEESLNMQGLESCNRILAGQPSWSDFPLILIAAAGKSSIRSSRRYNLLQKLGNLMILERPFHSETLITAVISALRSRRRQYEARSHLAELKQREEMFTELNKNLESRVILRTQELINSQDALGQAQKLEAVGRLAGGVAHDFNNLMTGILGIVEDVSSDLGAKDPHHKDLLSVLDAANRASQLTRQLLAFGRRQVASPAVVMLNKVIQNMRRLFSSVLPENVQISIDSKSRIGKVMVDASQIEQVFLNLILNARDAMPKGGKIKIVTKNVTLDKEHMHTLCDIEPGDYVSVSISDTGSGISAETMKHLFEPFYTTKKLATRKSNGSGTGSGMGLAMAYGLIKQHRGEICVTSAPGEGTTFQIYLPRFMGRTKVPRQSSLKPYPSMGGKETILLTEDEDIVRTISVRALKKRGYHVIQAQNAREAVKLSKAHLGTIDLLLTDVVMPGMNGQELAATIQLTRPHIRILFMSGYSREMVAKHGAMEAGTAFIEKAFSAEKLCHSVREILDQKEKQ